MVKIKCFVDYDSACKQYKDEAEEKHYNALKAYIINKKIKCDGSFHQEYFTPVFDDGVFLSMSYRQWGSFMAEIWNSIEGYDCEKCGYSYMDFYCSNTFEVKNDSLAQVCDDIRKVG